MKNFVRVFLGAVLGVVLGGLDLRAQTDAETTVKRLNARIPIGHFTTPPQMREPVLSPDGRYLALLQMHQDRYALVITDLNAPADSGSVAFDPGDNLGFRWVSWASNNRLLVSVPVLISKRSYTGFGSRLIAMSPQGTDVVQLFSPNGKSKNISQDGVIDLLPDDPEHILVNIVKSDPNKPEVHKVNLYTGKAKKVQPSKNPISYWMSDQTGDIRLGSGFNKNDYVVMTRKKGTTKWRTLWKSPINSGEEFSPITFLPNPSKILVESNHEGGPSAVYEFDIQSKLFEKRIFGHPNVDVSNVLLDASSKNLVGIEYILDGSEYHYVDDRAAEAVREIGKAIPNKQMRVVSTSQDGNRSVVFAGSPTDPGRYFVYDRVNKSVTEVGEVNPTLGDHNLSPMHPIRYRTRDNIEISGYLTLPRGIRRDDQPFLPMVILPHGGPTARDQLRYSYQVQFLASRGYAVLQMNFRGSSGYGTDFQEQGYGEWGQAMQDDITDGVAWAVNSGIADPNNVCIFGGSYGGYAALMGAIRTPDLYRCAASLNGVTNLTDMIDHATQYLGRHSVKHIGDIKKDEEKLQTYSPVTRASEIKIPIMLAHGTWDATVPYEQGLEMAKALKQASVDYRFITLEGADHSLIFRTHRNRFLTELEMFLEENLKQH